MTNIKINYITTLYHKQQKTSINICAINVIQQERKLFVQQKIRKNMRRNKHEINEQNEHLKYSLSKCHYKL